MNRTLALLAAALLTVASAHAIVADSSPRCVAQPDGTTVTLRLSGDEHSHYTATADGYTVLRRAADGAFVYAVAAADGSLAAGTMVAHDPAGRGLVEPAEDVQERCLPRAAASRDRHVLALLHREVHAVEHADRGLSRDLVLLDQVLYLKHLHGDVRT